MFNSPILDLVILLSFIYFIGSLIISTINESIAGMLRWRPDQLKQALETLFFSDEWSSFVRNKLIISPHIQSLMKATDKYPSYIPAKNFVLAVIGEIGSANYTQLSLQDAIANSGLPPDFKKVLGDLAASAGNRVDDFEKNLEEFYNNAMDRVGGVYKKKIRMLTLFIAFLLACFLNLDTVKVAKDELADTQKLSQTVDNIAAQMSNIKNNSGTVSIQTKGGVIAVTRKQDSSKAALAKKDTGKKAAVAAARDTTGTDISKAIKQANELTLYLQQNSGYNLGYADCMDFKEQWFGSPGSFLLKILGLLITAFALQLSSGFWFDLLNKAVNIRSSGKKPAQEKNKE
jgi:hypothetical protein